MPAVNWAVVPISMAVAAPRPVPVILTSLPPPAAPLVGRDGGDGRRGGTVPAGALEDVAGLASPEDADRVVPDWTRAGVTLPELTTPFTVIVPLVNGLVLFVHEICCPLGAPQAQPGPNALDRQQPGRQSLGQVTGWFSAAPEELAATVVGDRAARRQRCRRVAGLRDGQLRDRVEGADHRVIDLMEVSHRAGGRHPAEHQLLGYPAGVDPARRVKPGRDHRQRADQALGRAALSG